VKARAHYRTADRIRRGGIGNSSLESTNRIRCALREFERSDSGLPIVLRKSCGLGIVVLVRVPERTTIRVDRHRTVIAPAVVESAIGEPATLEPRSFNQRGLTLAEGV